MLDRFKSGRSVDYDKTCFHSVEKNFIILKEDLSNAKTAHTLIKSNFFIKKQSNHKPKLKNMQYFANKERPKKSSSSNKIDKNLPNAVDRHSKS